MHTLTDQQQLDNALELIKASGYTVTKKDEPAKAWEPKAYERIYGLDLNGNVTTYVYLKHCGYSALEKGNIFPLTNEGRAQAEATDKRRRLIAEAEREGFPNKGENYWAWVDGRAIVECWYGHVTDLAYFRSGNYSKTRKGLEDKIARYGADVVEGIR